MHKIYTFYLFIALSFFSAHGDAQERVLYKEVDSIKLFMEVYTPDEGVNDQAAILFFFGGGWKGGRISQFEHQAKYFSKRGLVCFLVEYRTEGQHKATPFECVKDAKSAMRYVRENADRFNIDPEKITASGGSAGGHLAAATALIEKYNEGFDDLSISCVPNALILFNPVFDNGPGGYGFERIGNAYKDFSPLHNIQTGAPPTLILLGTEDHLVPAATAEYYKTVMENVGSRCELKLYEGQGSWLL